MLTDGHGRQQANDGEYFAGHRKSRSSHFHRQSDGQNSQHKTHGARPNERFCQRAYPFEPTANSAGKLPGVGGFTKAGQHADDRSPDPNAISSVIIVDAMSTHRIDKNSRQATESQHRRRKPLAQVVFRAKVKGSEIFGRQEPWRRSGPNVRQLDSSNQGQSSQNCPGDRPIARRKHVMNSALAVKAGGVRIGAPLRIRRAGGVATATRSGFVWRTLIIGKRVVGQQSAAAIVALSHAVNVKLMAIRPVSGSGRTRTTRRAVGF